MAEDAPHVIDVPGCTCETRTQEQLDRCDVCDACVSYFDLPPMADEWEHIENMTDAETIAELRQMGLTDEDIEGHGRRIKALVETCMKLRETRAWLRRIGAIAQDQLRMHQQNGDGLGVTGRIESIVFEASENPDA